MTNAAELPGEFNVGDLIGNTYLVLGYLGRGAMGHVYHVSHQMLNVEYALKTLSRDKVTELAWRRFQNEAQAIARLNHPNIVQIYNLGLHEGVLPYYAMDLLVGCDLAQKIEADGPLDPRSAAALFIEVCSATGFAHKNGIIHRDIKPGNIFLLANATPAGARVKVVDFGIAKLSETKDPQNQMLTTMGDVVGTPFYMSPEQCTGEKVDARSDIYSLGCTLFEALTGVVPFRGRNPTETMMLHQSGEPPSLSAASGGRDFGSSLEYIVATTLAKQPSERYQTMDSLARDLTAAIEGTAPVIVAGGAVIAAPDLRSSRTKVADTLHFAALPSDNLQPIENRIATDPTFAAEASQPDARGALLNARKPKPAWLVFGLPFVFVTACMTFFILKDGPKHVVKLDKSATAVVIKAKTEATPSQLPDGNSQPKQGPSLEDPSAGEGKNKAESNFGFENDITFYDGPLPNQPFPNTSLLLTRPFCARLDDNGVKFRYYDFPKDIVIGLMASSNLQTSTQPPRARPYKAVGRFKIPMDAWVTFCPTNAAEHNHGCLKRFSAGDIDSVRFDPRFSDDKTLAEVSEIPSLKMLDFENCLKFTAASVPLLNKFTDLSTFDGAYSSYDGETLSKAKCWGKIVDFNLAKLKKARALLAIMPRLKNLKKLTLKDSNLKLADYQTIASLTDLTYINLDDNCISHAEMQALSSLPNLDEMDVRHACVDSSFAEIFRKFRKLKKVWVRDDRDKFGEFERLIRACPHIKFE